MRYIDAFNHFFPKRYYDALLETPAGSKDLGKRVRGIPALSDLDLRLRIVEQFENYSQVLSHGLPPIERLWGPDKSPEMAKIANDGLAEVVAKHPEAFRRLVGAVADERAGGGRQGGRARARRTAPMRCSSPPTPTACRSTSRNSWPIFEIIAKSGKPILLHPSRTREMPDYPTEKYSKYEICSVLGWPYETGVTLARLVFSKIMDRLSRPEGHRPPSRRRHPLSRRPRRPFASIRWACARRMRITRALRKIA